MSHKVKSCLSFRLVISMFFLLLFSTPFITCTQAATSGFSFVVLSDYSRTIRVGDEFYLLAISSNGKQPTFKSSNSSIASVNTYGKVLGKKNGTVTITAKVSKGEATCKVTVSKTKITLNYTSVSLNNGYCARLTASTSTNHPVTWKSKKSSVASVDANGKVTAKKPGSTTITVTADKVSVTCHVTVKKPTVKLSKSSVKLYRKQHLKLSVTSSSRSIPKWKSSKQSVVTVDDYGNINAIKHGTAIITVSVDGISKKCKITIKKPVIRLGTAQITLNKGQTYTPNVTVSSGNTPTYSSSNINVASVTNHGLITARESGKAYIYASEDGAKVRLIVHIR